MLEDRSGVCADADKMVVAIRTTTESTRDEAQLRRQVPVPSATWERGETGNPRSAIRDPQFARVLIVAGISESIATLFVIADLTL